MKINLANVQNDTQTIENKSVTTEGVEQIESQKTNDILDDNLKQIMAVKEAIESNAVVSAIADNEGLQDLAGSLLTEDRRERSERESENRERVEKGKNKRSTLERNLDNRYNSIPKIGWKMIVGVLVTNTLIAILAIYLLGCDLTVKSSWEIAGVICFILDCVDFLAIFEVNKAKLVAKDAKSVIDGFKK